MDVLNTRLEALERSVYAASSSVEMVNLVEQVAQVERQLNRTLAASSSLALGLQKYEKLSGVIDGDGDLDLHRRLLGMDAKAELILLNDGASQTLSDLSTIQDLQSRTNQPEYKTAADQIPKLHPIETKHGVQMSEFKSAVSDVSSLIDRYHSDTETLSEMFIQWDLILTTLERKVSELEAAQTA
ncbi:hypothetical protein GQ54DRAFT_296124 [Martensiomyces pterosporus]|nr:hypothetical protein GQ54DRAFT_296124 [Martensiomyces pterosporus]